MLNATFVLVNPKGLHARASHKLVETLCQYQSQCDIEFQGRVADGRQMMSVMLLAAPVGSALNFTFNGPDAADCMNAVRHLIVDGLGELGERTD